VACQDLSTYMCYNGLTAQSRAWLYLRAISTAAPCTARYTIQDELSSPPHVKLDMAVARDSAEEASKSLPQLTGRLERLDVSLDRSRPQKRSWWCAIPDVPPEASALGPVSLDA